MQSVREMTDFGKWRRVINTTSFYICLIVLLSETILFFTVENAGLLYLPVPAFLLRYLVIPSSLNFTILLIGTGLNRSLKISSEAKNYITCLTLFTICGISQCVHFIYSPMFCTTVVAIFGTIIFANPLLTRLLYILSLISLSVSGLIATTEIPKMPDYNYNSTKLTMDLIISAIICTCAVILANALIKFEEERAQRMYESYMKRIDLSEQVKRDPLTHLYNHSAIYDMAENMLSKRMYIGGIKVVMLELDGLNELSDKYGRINADVALVYFAECLKRNFDKSAYSARCSGDEFAVVISDMSVETISAIISEVRADFSSHKFKELGDEKLSFSFGIAEYTPNMWNSNDLFAMAEQKLAQSRRSVNTTE